MSSLPPVPPRVRRGPLQSIARLFRTWWSRKVTFAISLILTASAVLIYLFTFVGERPTPFFEFVQRLELSVLDTRFRFRGRSHLRPDSRIVIVGSDDAGIRTAVASPAITKSRIQHA